MEGETEGDRSCMVPEEEPLLTWNQPPRKSRPGNIPTEKHRRGAATYMGTVTDAGVWGRNFLSGAFLRAKEE